MIPTPESGTPAAIGYAEASGIPYGPGLVKNSYVGRTFIQPSQTIRQLGIRLKLNPLREVIRGKRLVVVDDSIVRGNTQRALVRMLREAGAAEVHVRISSPPVKWPCFYGIDFATRAELIANGMTVEEIGPSLGADSLGVHLARRADRGDHDRQAEPVPRLLRRRVPDRAARPRTARQAAPGDRAGAARRRRPTRCAVRDRSRIARHEGSLGMSETTAGASYAAAGVDIEAGDRAVELMKEWVARRTRPEVVGGLGGFAGLFDASALKRYERPLLATSTDGVGTKVDIARRLGVYDTIGHDLVGMVVDDLVVCGAEPLFMTDYIASARSSPSGSPRSSPASPRAASLAGLRAGRRRDRRAPRPARPRRVRRRRRRHRRGRGRPAARRRSASARATW